MMGKNGNSGSFWTTIPGMLTGCAAVITAVAALIGALVAIGFLGNDSTPTAPEPRAELPVEIAEGAKTSPASAEPSPDLLAIHESRLRNAIDLIATAEIQAQSELDEAPLHDIFIGEALKLEISNLELLRNNRLYVISRRHNITYESFAISDDGLHAEVRVTPKWESTYYSSVNQQCAGQIPAHDIPQTVFLELQESGWMVTAMVVDDDYTPPTLLQCGT
jgi:hypothetical protein